MSIGMLYWLIMVVWLFSWFGVWWNNDPRIGYVSSLILWILLALLGWHDFGAMIHA